MAIFQMTDKTNADKPNVKTVTNFVGAEIWRVYHEYGRCPHYEQGSHIPMDADCTDKCRNFESLYIEETYTGCVLDKGERNFHDDSDFYALAWDEASQSVVYIEYASTRGWSYPNHAVIDATPEVRIKADAWNEAQLFELWKADNAIQASRVELNKRVKVVKGRKLEIGTEGEVVWIGEDRYKRGAKRVGLLVNGSRVFTALDNVAVANPEAYLKPEAWGRESAQDRRSDHRSWRASLAGLVSL